MLDSEILADVYLAMTGGQVGLGLHDDADGQNAAQEEIRRLPANRPVLKVIYACDDELIAHEERLKVIDSASQGACVWRVLA